MSDPTKPKLISHINWSPSAEGNRLRVPPAPKKLIDPRPNTALAAKAADILVPTDGPVYVTDWNAGLNVLQYEG